MIVRTLARDAHVDAVLLSIPQAAARLGTTISAVRNLIWSGDLGFCRLGKRHLIPVAETEKWIARNLERNAA
jgi:excisionase family DNA binding protein